MAVRSSVQAGGGELGRDVTANDAIVLRYFEGVAYHPRLL